MTQEFNYDAEYASEVIKSIPVGYIDKTVPGCGLTTVALENNEDTVVAVPGVALIANKVGQYPNSRCGYKVFGVAAGVTTADVDKYIAERGDQPIKVMVTYDSIHKVEHLLEYCKLIIDESDQLLSGADLKSKSKAAQTIDVCTNLLSVAEYLKDEVSFISATPVPVSYLPKWVSTIPQIKMNWKDTVTMKPLLMKRGYVNNALVKEVLKPMVEAGSVEFAGLKVKKAIVFINSVTGIIETIKKAGIEAEDVAIIAGDSLQNDIKIKGYNRLQDPHKLPKYTFVTSTGFKGIDLYDKEAVSIVVSNTTRTFSMIDLLTDLRQATTRQRLKSNPNYGKFLFIYNQTVFDKPEKELIAELEEKRAVIESGIRSIERNAKVGDDKANQLITANEEFNAYTNYDRVTGKYTFNENLFNADKYFILVIRKQFTEGFSIKGEFDGAVEIDSKSIIEKYTYNEVARYFKEHKAFGVYKSAHFHVSKIKRIYEETGRVHTVEDEANKALALLDNEYEVLRMTVEGAFQRGHQYSNTQIKEILAPIYAKHSLDRKPQPKQLAEFLMVKPYRTSKERGLEIVGARKEAA